jgi:hypothetical protein
LLHAADVRETDRQQAAKRRNIELAVAELLPHIHNKKERNSKAKCIGGLRGINISTLLRKTLQVAEIDSASSSASMKEEGKDRIYDGTRGPKRIIDNELISDVSDIISKQALKMNAVRVGNGTRLTGKFNTAEFNNLGGNTLDTIVKKALTKSNARHFPDGAIPQHRVDNVSDSTIRLIAKKLPKPVSADYSNSRRVQAVSDLANGVTLCASLLALHRMLAPETGIEEDPIDPRLMHNIDQASCFLGAKDEKPEVIVPDDIKSNLKRIKLSAKTVKPSEDSDGNKRRSVSFSSLTVEAGIFLGIFVNIKDVCYRRKGIKCFAVSC